MCANGTNLRKMEAALAQREMDEHFAVDEEQVEREDAHVHGNLRQKHTPDPMLWARKRPYRYIIWAFS